MTEPITKEQLIDASADALTLEQVVNGSDTTDVTSRLARTYPTLAKALRLIVQNGLLGATAFNLASQMVASSLVDGDYAVVTDDPNPENNGFYQRQAGLWEFLEWNPINQFMTALAAETSARTAADSANASAISAEQSTRTGQVATLTAQIGAESATRAGADTTLQNNIDAEQAARIASDDVLSDLIGDEEAARIAAIATEQSARATAITAESTARQSADAVINAELDAEIATRSELIDADYTDGGQIVLKNALGFIFGLLGIGESKINGVKMSDNNLTADSIFASNLILGVASYLGLTESALNGVAFENGILTADSLIADDVSANAISLNNGSTLYPANSFFEITNALGFVFGLLGVDISVLNGVTLTGGNIAAKSALADRYDFSNGCFLYPTTVNYFEITNGLGFIIAELPSVSGGGVAPTVLTDLTKPLFSKTLCGWAGEPITIHVPQLLQNRAEQAAQKHVTATIISTDTTGTRSFCAESDVTLSVRPDLIGASAELHLRDSRTNAVRTVLPITKCAGVPQGTGQSIKVLMIGDSITDRGGAACVAAQLTAHGYTPQMIGTVLGTSIAPSGAGGLLGEGRGGAQFAHYSYIFTSRSAVAAGGESAYLALPKTDQVNRNPFVRLTVGGDNGSFVLNGHIFDMRFYLNRFSLSDPDVVYINLGTNDILTQTTAGMIANVSASLNIMLRQTRTALPAAKIIVALPSTAYSADKDAVWAEGYYNAIRTIQATVDAIADAKTFICAEWAVMPANAGFALSGSTDATSGAINGAWSDDLHPIVGGRTVKYSFAAAHIVAAHLNLI